MAEIRVERKSSNSWIWWVLGLLVLALIIWWLFAANDADEVETGAVAPPVVEEPAPLATEPATTYGETTGAELPIAAMLASPADWQGRPVEGTASVAEVVSDRGFWVGDGQRLFVVLDELPSDVKEINAGQTVRFTDAELRTPDSSADLPGDLDANARQIVEGQDAVVLADSLDIEILEGSGA